MFPGNGCLPEKARGTADFLLFGDKLFDSVNGSLIDPEHGKSLRCAVKEDSPHVDFWYEAIQVLQTVKYVPSGKSDYVPPTIKNWISTLHGFIYIWKKLKEVGFQYLLPRNLNQDPLENFFGCVRSHGVRNVNPSCDSFISSFKSLIINNFMSAHSPASNCEKDESEGALDSLKEFLMREMEGIAPTDTHEDALIDPKFVFSDTKHAIIIKTHAYIAGYLARRILRAIGGCKQCKNALITKEATEEHLLIEERAYNPKALVRPSTPFINIFSKCNDVVHHYLPMLCTENLSRKC